MNLDLFREFGDRLAALESLLEKTIKRVARVEDSIVSRSEIRLEIHDAVKAALAEQVYLPTVEQMLPVIRQAMITVRQEEQEARDEMLGRRIRTVMRNPKQILGITTLVIAFTGVTNITQALEVLKELISTLGG